MLDGVEVIIRQPGHADRVVRLQEGSVRLGRADDNEIVLSDVGVSRRHSLINVTPSQVQIEDLGSGNGTYYRGYRVKVQTLADGDEIVIDPFVLQFKMRTGPKPAAVKTAPTREAAPARLEVVTGHGMVGSIYPITDAGLTIGRSEERDVVMPDPAASRHHVSIYVDNGRYTLKDMGSANGVFVNAVRVRECLLAHNDVIRIGNTELRFVMADGREAEGTTHVVSQEPWPRERRSGGAGWVALVVGGASAAFVAVLVSVLAIILIVVLVGQNQSRREPLPAHPPRWALALPNGLPGVSVTKLFDEGTAAMQGGDNRLALQNFYRVLFYDQGNSAAKKFAFAAGERLVVSSLKTEFDAVAAAKASRDVERDRLLKAKDNAKNRAVLEEQYGDDPAVRAALGLGISTQDQALQSRMVEATNFAAASSWGEAAKAYREVLVGTQDPKLRETVQMGYSSALQQLARSTSSDWRAAVGASVRGDREAARAAFTKVNEKDPGNISYKVHTAVFGP